MNDEGPTAMLIELLETHHISDELECRHKERTLQFLRDGFACTSRATMSGHIVASAWVLSPDHQSSLLTMHKKLGRWLQLGGHIEDGETVRDAALREVREESGIPDLAFLTEGLLDIDVHSIPANRREPEHLHFDFRFLLHARTPRFRVSDESNKLAWVSFADIESMTTDESIIRMARKARAFLLDRGV